MSQLVAVSRVNPHLPHNSVELQSPPPPDALDNDMAVRNADEIVSRLLHQGVAVQVTPASRAQRSETANNSVTRNAGDLPRAAPASGPAKTPGVHSPATGVVARGACRLPELARDPSEAELRAVLTADVGMTTDKAGGLWLGPAHGIVIACGLGLLLWPVGFAALLLALAVAVFAGAALLRRAAAGGLWRRFARRHPRGAEKLRRRADRLAERLDHVLDLLPDAVAERLALPDLSEPLTGGRRRH